MKQPKGRSLADFLAERPKQRECVVCDLPQAAEINATRAAGTARGRRTKCEDILDWLVNDQGVSGKVTVKLLQAHFNGRHHEAA